MTSVYDDESSDMSRQLWRRNERKQWMVALFFGSAALYSSRLILHISSYNISNEFQWDRKSTAFVLGSFFYGYMLTQILGGYMADKFGGEKVLTRAAFVWGLITLIFPHLPGISSNKSFKFYMFVLCRFLLGIFQGFHFPSIASLMAKRVVETERQFTFSIMNGGSHFGTLLCGSLGSFLMEYYGWRVSFYFIGFLSIMWASFVTRYLLTRFIYNDQEINIIMIEEGAKAESKKINKLNEKKVVNTTYDIVRSLAKHSAFWAMLFAHFTHSNSFVILISWLPSYFHDHYPDAKSWVFNVVPYLINIPSTLISGLLADYLIKEGYSVTYVRKLITTIVLLGTGSCLLILSTVNNYFSALVWMSLAFCACGFHCSGVLLNPQDLGPNHGGSIYGIMSMVGAVPGFAGVYFVGFILDTSKSWPLVFQSTGVFCIAGWIVYQIFGSAKQIV